VLQTNLRLVSFYLLSATAITAEPLETFQDCDVCPEMIELPLGEFVMGAPDSEFRTIAYIGYNEAGELAQLFATPEEPYIPANEGPQNKVIVDRRIAIGRNEVTFDEWMACVNDGGCGGYIPNDTADQWGSSNAIEQSLADPRFERTPSQREISEVVGNPESLHISGRYPINEVSYQDATAYVNWLNEKLRTDAYRLPTEAEWEYAARGGTSTRFAQGYEPTAEQANISGAATASMEQRDRPDLRTLGHPVPVDELDAANAWGVRHMSGNLEEITLSCYSGETATLPSWVSTSEWLEKSIAKSCDRTLRGGNYGQDMSEARVAARGPVREQTRFDFIGFRVLKEVEEY
jgi:formylglycine-generating enzyme required for sulfatase activity